MVKGSSAGLAAHRDILFHRLSSISSKYRMSYFSEAFGGQCEKTCAFFQAGEKGRSKTAFPKILAENSRSQELCRSETTLIVIPKLIAQTLSAFCTAAGKHFAAIAVRHSFAETVLLFAMEFLRLISSQHSVFLLSKDTLQFNIIS